VADISLDDLLPVNDSVYEPPDDLMEVFAKGGPAWELADLLKWVNGADEKFAAGWQAGIFEVVLKLGCAFGTWVRTSCVDDFVQRARAFGRHLMGIRGFPSRRIRRRSQRSGSLTRRGGPGEAIGGVK